MTTHTWGERTRYDGKPANWGLRYLQQAANKMLATPHFGGESSPTSWYQGAYSQGAQSAGTHGAGDAADTTPHNAKNREKVLRLLGCAAWIREAIPGVWVKHIHYIVDGGIAAAAGQRQVASYHRRRNGLAGDGPDRGYRMLVFPLFVFPEKEVGKPGKRYCTTACHAYHQPTALAERYGPEVKVGDVLEVVAVVNVNGRYWGITADGRCVWEGNFSRTKPTTTSTPAPAPSPVVTEPAPVPTPPAPVAVPPDLRMLNMNVCARYRTSHMPTYANSVDELAQLRADARASLVVTTESGSYSDAARLSKAMGWGGKAFVLHGGSLPITTAVHWDPEKYKLVREWGNSDTDPLITLPGSTHRWGTLVKLEQLASSEDFGVGVTHLQYLPKGPNDVKRYDVERHDQLGAMLRHCDRLVPGLPRFCAGDFNSTRHDMYDASVGVGKAMAEHGYTDAAVEAGGRAHIDRIATKQVRVRQHMSLPTRGATDHPYAVAILATLES